MCKGLKFEFWIGDVWIKGNIRRDIKIRLIVRIFLSLFGIFCKIVYIGKKYYFGIMCVGVDIGFVGI